jgi:hypothetical protein
MSEDDGDDRSFGWAIAIGAVVLVLILLAAAVALFGLRLPWF